MPRSNAHARSLIFDSLLALGIGLLCWSITIPLSDNLRPTERAIVLGLVTVHAGSIAFRRVRPWAAYFVGLASGLIVVGSGLPLVVLTLAPVVMLYSVSSQFPARRSLVALALSGCAFVVAEGLTGFADDADTIAGDLVALGAAWLIGWFVYGRQEYVHQLEAQTAQLKEAREELARAAVTEERLRIARELHDIVAHSLSVIAVQSGVGAHVLDSDPEEARAALSNIERSSRNALNEMRALLGMLRNPDGNLALAPLPGLSQLPSLIEEVSSAGPAVELQVRGEKHDLPAGLDLTAYRVIQESLTNVVRHSQADHARVSITYEPRSIVIEVVDDGSASVAAQTNGGLGIEGMRERLAAFGGSLQAAPLREGGFRVRAELPLSEAGS